MKVTFFGVRGSIPVSEKDFVKVGGNTSCVLAEYDDGKILILDAGTGIRALGRYMLDRSIEQDNIFIALSHTHWDHTHGFPFFKPALGPRLSLPHYSFKPSNVFLNPPNFTMVH